MSEFSRHASHERTAGSHRSVLEWVGQHSVRRGIAGIALSAVVASGTPAAGMEYEHATSPVMLSVPSPDFYDHAHLPSQGADECEPAQPGAYQLALELIDNPPRTGITISEGTIGPLTSDAIEKINEERADKTYQLYETAAADYGLTVHDVRPYIEHLSDDKLRGYQLPLSEYVDQANEFLSLYGVEISYASPDDDFAYEGLRAPTREDLETATAKSDVYELMQTFASLPEEYVRQISGLRHIVLTGGPHAPVSAYASLDGAHDTVHYNISQALTGDTLLHEINHLDDAALCGGVDGMEHDPSYTSHNAKGVRYGDKNTKTYEDVEHESPSATGRKHNGGVSFIDDYASTKLVEDKADTGSRIESRDGLAEMTSGNMPPRVVDKYETLLARLGQAYPALAYYFMAIQS